MCGIAGLYEPRPPAQRQEVMRAMLASVAHRGPDDEGVWSDASAPVTLGHRRLAVIDTSPAGHEPMHYAGSRYVLTFNGEIYNFEELRAELTARGHAFRSATDAEVLLAGYAEWGTSVLGRLVGMFAFAIWDAQDRVLFLARDRAGEKPLYYAHDGGRLAFASELPALRQCRWVDTGTDPVAQAQYLQYGYVPAPLTSFRGVRKLPPAHSLLFDGHGLTVARYWDPVPHAAGPRLAVTETEAVDELGRLLARAVTQQSIADVPLGAFLSGGIDSSTIVGLMASGGSRVRTFTIGFDEEEFDESGHAQAVADHLGTNHVTERLTLRDAARMVEELPAMYGEPFGDPSALPTYLVSSIARKHVTVSLSGDGGDELFGGYAVYDRLARWERSLRLARPLRGTIVPALAHLPGRPGRQARRLLEYSAQSMGVGYRHYFTPDEVRRMTALDDLGVGIIDQTWRATGALPTVRRAMVTDFAAYLPEDVLTKVDRAAMATSLETRAPFLDHRVVEWALALPDDLVRGKRLLRGLLRRMVPSELFERPKRGFSVPVARWLRTDLREALLDELTPASLAEVGIAWPEPIERMARLHLSGRADYGRWLWLVYTLRRWHRHQRERAVLVA